MPKINKHIEIVSSSNTRLSSMSQPSREAIRRVLSRHYRHVDITLVDTVADLEALVERSPDLVFLGIKYILTDTNSNTPEPAKIWISQYLEDRGIACTGSTSSAHQLELDKPLAKQQAQTAGLATSPFRVVAQGDVLGSNEWLPTFPVFIKPTDRGGGLGIDSQSVAHNFEQLQAKIASIATQHGSDSLVEEFLGGREFSVAVLRNGARATYTAMPIELIAAPNQHGVRMLGSETKASNQEEVVEVTDLAVRGKINQLALGVFAALGGRDYGRIDIRMSESGKPHFLEANLIPSLIAGYGSFPKACLINQRLDHESVLVSIVESGLERSSVMQVADSLDQGYGVPATVFA